MMKEERKRNIEKAGIQEERKRWRAGGRKTREQMERYICMREYEDLQDGLECLG